MQTDRVPGKPRRLLDRAKRATALSTVEVVPVAGVLALQRDDAGALLARSIAADIGEPPLVADTASVGKMPWHPGLCRRAQEGHDGVEVVADLRRKWMGRVVEVNQGSRAPVPPA